MTVLQSVLKGLKEGLVARLPSAPPGYDPSLARPPDPALGDLAIAGFPLAGTLHKPPHQIASDWAGRLPPGTLLGALRLERAEAAGGFVNLRFESESLLAAACGAIAGAGDEAEWIAAAERSRVMVEYSSPNTNKPLHLGHVRNNAIGMAVSNLLEACGHEVIRVNLVNDRGIHICKSMLAYKTWGGGETPATTGEKGDRFVGRYYVRYDQALREERAEFLRAEGIDPAGLDREERERLEERFLSRSVWAARAQEMLQRWEEGDPETLELWRTMNGWVYEGFRATYERLGCHFDKWYYESETWKLGRLDVERGLAEGIFYRKEDGSVWARLEDVGLQDKLLLRSDGTSVYITQDIGTARRKHEDFGMDRSLYVVGQEQVLHFKNLFAILERLGYPWAAGCRHVAYGLVTLPRGMGRLKSREGTAVDADDLLDLLREEARRKIVEGGYCGDDPDRIESTAEAIGQGALKVYLLQVGNDKNIVFDPGEKLSFEGDTGPAIQYSHARICGIVRKGLDRGLIREEDLIPEGTGPAGIYRAVRAERVDYSRLGAGEERELALQILGFAWEMETASRQLSAAPIANHLLGLTRTYARFYHEHRVLDAPDEATRIARLQLSLCVARALRRGLAILTVEAPDRM